jgi:hypothetical protein
MYIEFSATERQRRERNKRYGSYAAWPLSREGATSMVVQVAPSLLDSNWSSLVCFQGVLMLQDQYRAIMHFSIPKETQIERNALKSSQDWICIKVHNIYCTCPGTKLVMLPNCPSVLP